MYAHADVCLCACVHMYECVYVCMYACMGVFVYECMRHCVCLRVRAGKAEVLTSWSDGLR